MNSFILYGRLLTRALFQGLNNEKHNQIAWSSTSSPRHLPLKTQLRLLTATAGIGLASKRGVRRNDMFGDDACFVAEHKVADVLGVADGVGGWRRYGVDPTMVPYTLMETCKRFVQAGKFQAAKPAAIISASYMEIKEEKEAMLGSCTACVVSFCRQDKTLYSANIGDSGLLVIREGEVVHRSSFQQHYFNTPFQLAIAPSEMDGLVIDDSPESAASASFGMEEGDFVLLGTDGLFDNLPDQMIISHISKIKDSRLESVQTAANEIVRDAYALGLDPEYMSPFSMNAQKFGLTDVKGGKPDDVTVLLSRVTADSIAFS